MLRVAADALRVARGAGAVVEYQLALVLRGEAAAARTAGVSWEGSGASRAVGGERGDSAGDGGRGGGDEAGVPGMDDGGARGNGQGSPVPNAAAQGGVVASEAGITAPVDGSAGKPVPTDPVGAAAVPPAGDSPAGSSEVSRRAEKRQARAAAVPASSISRAIGFGSLGVRLFAGAATEVTKRLFTGAEGGSRRSALMTAANAQRIASSLSRMRGAALKLGQMLSIQDKDMLPKELAEALETVRQNADYMPLRQLNYILASELGSEWRSHFSSFEEQPVAAASIGQVHRAVLADGTRVAVKVQYPGVADSIHSDLGNLKRLVTLLGVVPKSYYLDEAIAFAGDELSRECDYVLEASKQNRFHEQLAGDRRFRVPRAFTALSSKRVLTSEWVDGKPIDHFTAADGYSQEFRDRLGSLLMELTLNELFVMRNMQTDPNFSNFFYDGEVLSLLDFGAAREFDKGFVDDYLRMVVACAERDRDTVLRQSQKIGFLTGHENKVMLDAHVAASFIVGEPFQNDEPYDFKTKNVAGRTARYAHVLAENRLKPPPTEVYSLHRRLSGAFLMCMRLDAKVRGRHLLMDVYNNYEFDGTEPPLEQAAAAT